METVGNSLSGVRMLAGINCIAGNANDENDTEKCLKLHRDVVVEAKEVGLEEINHEKPSNTETS